MALKWPSAFTLWSMQPYHALFCCKELCFLNENAHKKEQQRCSVERSKGPRLPGGDLLSESDCVSANLEMLCLIIYACFVHLHILPLSSFLLCLL